VVRVALAVPGSGDGGGGGGSGGGDGGGGGEPQPGQLLFSDSFSRTSSSDLGSDWLLSGLWRMDGKWAISDLDNPDGDDLAFAVPSSCADCQVQAQLQAFAVNEAGVVLRAQGDARYALVLLPDGRIQIRRYRDGSYTVLGEAPGGQASPEDAATLSLSAWGSGPVRLSASVNGQSLLTVTDSDPAAITGEGLAGLATPIAGVWFDDFQVHAVSAP